MKHNANVKNNFLMLLVICVIIYTTFLISFPEIPLKYYFLFIWNSMIVVFTVFKGLLKGLVCSMISIFIYGSYLIYDNMIYNSQSTNYFDLLWIAFFVACAYFTGHFIENLNHLIEKNQKSDEILKRVALLDYETGFGNMKSFHSNLVEDMNEARRFKEDLSIIIMKIKFFEDLESIHGEKKAIEIVKKITISIEEVIRTYDKTFRLSEDTFAIICPKTNNEGAEVVKKRLNDKISVIKLDENGTDMKFSYKIGISQYDWSDIGTSEFKDRAYIDMEYDVG